MILAGIILWCAFMGAAFAASRALGLDFGQGACLIMGLVFLVGWGVKRWVDNYKPSQKELDRLYGPGGGAELS